MPNGYVFVPKGDPYVTRHCRQRTLFAGDVLYNVLNGKRQVVGLRCPSSIAMIVFRNDVDTKATREAIVTVKDQKEIAEARTAFVRLFPRALAKTADAVVAHAFKKRSQRVGRKGNLTIDEKVTLAAGAHARHTYTNYDALLRSSSMERSAARKAVGSNVQAQLMEWRALGDRGVASRIASTGGSNGESSEDSDAFEDLTVTVLSARSSERTLRSATRSKQASQGPHNPREAPTKVTVQPTDITRATRRREKIARRETEPEMREALAPTTAQPTDTLELSKPPKFRMPPKFGESPELRESPRLRDPPKFMEPPRLTESPNLRKPPKPIESPKPTLAAKRISRKQLKLAKHKEKGSAKRLDAVTHRTAEQWTTAVRMRAQSISSTMQVLTDGILSPAIVGAITEKRARSMKIERDLRKTTRKTSRLVESAAIFAKLMSADSKYMDANAPKIAVLRDAITSAQQTLLAARTLRRKDHVMLLS